jgi:NADH-quinone oxidoreductase subunit A
VVYGFLVLAVMAVLLLLTRRLGEHKHSIEKARPYESGVIPTGFSQFHQPVLFYLVAIFFLIFDAEAAFIFAWAVAFRPLGVTGWLRISFFIAILLLSLVYIWRKGGLDWKTGN